MDCGGKRSATPLWDTGRLTDQRSYYRNAPYREWGRAEAAEAHPSEERMLAAPILGVSSYLQSVRSRQSAVVAALPAQSIALCFAANFANMKPA
jgi:hypothetical protein